MAKKNKQKTKKKQQKIAPLLNPMAPLRGKDLRRTARALTNIQLRPQLGALDRAADEVQRTNEALSRRIADYLQSAAPIFQASQQAQSSASQALSERLAGVQARSMHVLDDIENVANLSLQSDANLRGPGLDAGSAHRVANEIAGARAMAQGTDAIASEQALRNAAAFEGLANMGSQIAALRAQDIQGVLANQLAGEMRDIRGRRADVEAQRGPLMTGFLTDLREREFEQAMARRAFRLQRQGQRFEQRLARDTFDLSEREFKHRKGMDEREMKLAEQTLKLNNQTRMAEIQAGLTKHWTRPIPSLGMTYEEFMRKPLQERMKLARRANRRRARVDMGKVNEYGFTEREWRAMSTPERQRHIRRFRGDGGSAAAKRRERIQKGRDALAEARSLAMVIGPAYGSKTKKGQKVNGSYIRRWLASKLNDDALVEAAMDFIFNYGKGGRLLGGKLRSSTIKRLRQRGIPRGAIPRSWRG